jgi:peptidoglycan/xylan/chitin deacetylase (PgdA/CDA1 family)
MEEGAPRFFDLLSREGIPATAFATGDVARRYPDQMARLVDAGHELGCHGDTHRRFSTMTTSEAAGELDRSTETLRAFAPVTSFRAPNLDYPAALLPLLADRGYTLDSSIARYKPHKGHPSRPVREGGVLRVPASTMPSLVRLPGLVRPFVLGWLREPLVLFFHPWEFVDVTREPIPWDCRFRTGAPALASLAAAIAYLRRRGDSFVLMRDFANSAA